ncbi:MAG: ABC transporter ATP-binding protein [Actinomycetales bacterium]|nr:ABC transporter ATP-binding protein [Actinomycetales bacterium]
MTRMLGAFLRPYRGRVGIAVLLLLAQAIGNLYLPSLNADIINDGVITGDTGYILRVGGVMLLVTVLLGVFAVGAVYLAAQVAMGVGRDLRRALFRTVQDFSSGEMGRFGAPSLITRTTNDVQQVQMFVLMGLTMMVLAPITGVGGVIMALRENLRLSALLVVVLPLLALVVGAIVRSAVPQFRAMQRKLDAINRVMRENLTGIRVIRAFVRTAHEERRFGEANADLTRTALTVGRLFALAFPSIMLIMNLTTVAVVWFGGHLVDDGTMPIGDLTAFLSYVMQILFSVMMAVFMVVMVPRAAASAERVQEVLATEPAIRDAPRSVTDDAAAGLVESRGVEFRGVEFRYPGAEEPVLRDVSLMIRPGEVTAIVGSTGSGKSTLVNLIPRLYDVTAGRLLVDGVDVRDLSRDRLWSGIGLVPQRAFLFSGTVASNVRLGDEDATDDEVRHALEVAQAAAFVDALPEGIEAPVEQGGVNLSGGQRQRLAIARALVRRPGICIFDDSFSALDYATDARLRAALRTETAEATVIIVAQRVSTVLHADRIVVLDGGTVVGTGTHEELMRTCETYREIVYSQLTEDDVA